MATLSYNDIARAIFEVSKDKADHNAFTKSVVAFLAKKRLISKSDKILSKFEEIYNKHQGIIVAKVSSTNALDPNTKSIITKEIGTRYNAKQVFLSESINPKLLGGFKIEINDEIIDLSVSNKLKKLQEHLTN